MVILRLFYAPYALPRPEDSPPRNDVDPTYDRDGLAYGPAEAGKKTPDGDKADSELSTSIPC